MSRDVLVVGDFHSGETNLMNAVVDSLRKRDGVNVVVITGGDIIGNGWGSLTRDYQKDLLEAEVYRPEYLCEFKPDARAETPKERRIRERAELRTFLRKRDRTVW